MFSEVRQREVQSGLKRSSVTSHNLVERLQRVKLLEGHTGCVNTVGFSEDGELVLSGSDDKRVMIWNWHTGKQVLAYKSGHRNNIFQARFLPQTNSSTVVTCAADGQVRVGYIRSDGSKVATSLLASHGDRAHKLALDPEAHQCFYSCGEDGRVFHYDLRCPSARQSLLVCTKSNEFRADKLQLNSIHCNPLRPWQFVVGGSDIFARVYDQRRSLTSTAAPPTSQPAYAAAALASPVRKLAPKSLRRQNKQFRSELTCHITCANFSRKGEIVATYNDELIYLFASEGPSLGWEPRKMPEASNLRKRRKHSGSPEGLTARFPVGAGTRAEAADDMVNGIDGAATEALESQPASAHSPSAREVPTDALPAAHGAAQTGSPEGAAGGPEGRGLGQDALDQTREPDADGRQEHGAGASEPGHLRDSAGSTSAAVEDPSGSRSTPPSDREQSSEDSSSPSDSDPYSDESSDESSEGSGVDGAEGGSLEAFEERLQYQEYSSSEEDSGGGSEGMEVDDDEEGFADDLLGVDGGAEQPAARAQEDDDLAGFCDEVVMTFSGHRNCQTVKGVSFLGEEEQYVMSGSDDGHIYVWSKADGVLRTWLRGDNHIVNCLEPHPIHPMAFATSGIDSDIKLWAPASPEPCPIPEKAAAVMERNARSRGSSHRRIPTATARSILLRLQHLAQSREEALQQVEASQQQRQAGQDASQAASRVQEAMNAHRRFRRQFEEDLDDPGQDGDQTPTPGDCTIA